MTVKKTEELNGLFFMVLILGIITACLLINSTTVKDSYLPSQQIAENQTTLESINSF